MWQCGKCGEKSEDQFDTCWNCMTEKGETKPDRELVAEAKENRKTVYLPPPAENVKVERPEKPACVKTGVLLLWATLGLGIVRLVYLNLFPGSLIEDLARSDAGFKSEVSRLSPGQLQQEMQDMLTIITVIAVIAWIVEALIIFLVSRGKNWARWLAAISLSLSMVYFGSDILNDFKVGNISVIWDLLSFALQFVAIAFLYKSEANDWYNYRKLETVVTFK